MSDAIVKILMSMRARTALSAAGLIGVFLLGVAPCALAGAFNAESFTLVGKSTCNGVKITGRAQESFTIEYTDPTGKAQIQNVKLGGAPLSADTSSFCVDAGKKTIITVKNKTQPDEKPEEVKAIASLDPPSNTTVTAFVIDPAGSVVTLGGNTFTLDGGYTTLTTSVDHDRLSPTFGALGGVILASDFNISGSGSAGTFTIALDADAPLEANIGSLWEGTEVPSSGVSLPFIQMLMGTLSFEAIQSSFVGTISGTATFFENDQETVSGNIDFLTDFGAITGTFSSTGQSMLIAVAEPPALALVLVAGLGYLAIDRRRRQKIGSHEVFLRR